MMVVFYHSPPGLGTQEKRPSSSMVIWGMRGRRVNCLSNAPETRGVQRAVLSSTYQGFEYYVRRTNRPAAIPAPTSFSSRIPAITENSSKRKTNRRPHAGPDLDTEESRPQLSKNAGPNNQPGLLSLGIHPPDWGRGHLIGNLSPRIQKAEQHSSPQESVLCLYGYWPQPVSG